ncbi:hypothetical protein [Shewanella surugensis]|uniref:Uncharacterized protein n=1 Tax=Shewanella surugensis TaxID=212020 RepID=A0ABT0LBS4_9GAMM|nr:hypothetical protein [Shewanella surugensis]MCL1124641.1 hypothetical protein [Shewanella surugensis]
MALDFNTGRFSDYKLSISDSRLDKIQNAVSEKDATHMGIFDKLKDMILGTHKAEALTALYELTHNPKDTLDTSSAISKMKSFTTLKNSLSDTYKANLSARI